MTASAVPLAADPATAARVDRGHLGLAVLTSIATGLAVGLLLVLVVFAGGPEADITGGALLGLGAGFALLAFVSSRLTRRPQQWAFPPAVASTLAGLALVTFAPGERALGDAGWIWPVLLVILVGWSFRGAHRSLDSWSRRALLYPSLFVLLLVAAGGAFETVTAATATNPAPASGRTYVVDGQRLYLSCTGSGAPTVVLFNGLGERTPSWAWVQRSVSSTTRVCAFDRAGEGWSGGTTRTGDGRRLAADLHGLLRAARIDPPYVLAGHSVGGTYALVYAAQYPAQVAGVALVDSSSPEQFDLPDYPSFYSMWRRASALLPSLARTGIARPTLGSGFGSLPPGARHAAATFAASPRELSADRVEVAGLPRVFDEARQLESLDGAPLAVVSASVGAQRGWAHAQERLARLSTNSTYVTIDGATHTALLVDRRYAWFTSRAIADVVRRARQVRWGPNRSSM